MQWLGRKSEDGLYRETSGGYSARRAFNRRGEEGEFGFLQLDEKKFGPKSGEKFDFEDVRKDGESAGDAGTAGADADQSDGGDFVPKIVGAQLVRVRS